MSCNNKPPMTLYLQNAHPLHEEPWRDDDVTWCRDKIFRHDVGPYVHIGQFLAEAKKLSKKMNRFLPEIIEIMEKEINEQTIPATKTP